VRSGAVRRCATVRDRLRGRSGALGFLHALACSRTVVHTHPPHGIQEVEGSTPFGPTLPSVAFRDVALILNAALAPCWTSSRPDRHRTVTATIAKRPDRVLRGRRHGRACSCAQRRRDRAAREATEAAEVPRHVRTTVGGVAPASPAAERAPNSARRLPHARLRNGARRAARSGAVRVRMHRAIVARVAGRRLAHLAPRALRVVAAAAHADVPDLRGVVYPTFEQTLTLLPRTRQTSPACLLPQFAVRQTTVPMQTSLLGQSGAKSRQASS
jgi:hypothetical protein